MPDTTFTIGSEARCTDGGARAGVSRVVVDPVAQAVTHLVVGPKDRARACPAGAGSPVRGGVALGPSARRCWPRSTNSTRPRKRSLILGSVGYAAYGPQQVVAWPYYGRDN